MFQQFKQIHSEKIYNLHFQKNEFIILNYLNHISYL